MVKIAVVTGSRADWGLLNLIAHRIEYDPALFDRVKLTIIPCGSLLRGEFSQIYRQIQYDYSRVYPLTGDCTGDSAMSICGAGSDIEFSMSGYLSNQNCDAVIILGDRWESFHAAVAAHIHDVPIIHIHGGEVTIGSYDDAFRDCISRMAELHFPATEMAAKRLRKILKVQHGTASMHDVFMYGALGCENLYIINPNLDPGYDVVISYYPETKGSQGQLSLHDVMSVFNKPENSHLKILHTGVSMDKGSSDFKAYSCLNVDVKADMDRMTFLGHLKNAKMIVGNSSAGIIEAPCLNTLTLNIGDRQSGREFASSVWTVRTLEQLENEVRYILSLYNTMDHARIEENFKVMYRPYSATNTAQNITDEIIQTLERGIRDGVR